MWKIYFFIIFLNYSGGLFYNCVNKEGFVMIKSISEITQLWERALKRIEEQLGEKQLFDSFFTGTYIHEISGNTIVVVVNSPLSKAVIQTKYYDMVTSVINNITESNFRLEFVLEKEIKESSVTIEAPVEKKPQYFKNNSLNSNLTFSNFVVGNFNREASQAALLIASNPGKMFNPLFIYSQSGLGKTHLLHAIGNYILKEKNPNAKILYITANDFVEEYVRFVRGEKEAQSLKDYFESVDVLLLDDVQFLWEFVILNALMI